MVWESDCTIQTPNFNHFSLSDNSNIVDKEQSQDFEVEIQILDQFSPFSMEKVTFKWYERLHISENISQFLSVL